MPPDTVAARPRASLEWLRSPAALGEAPPSPSVLVCGDVRPPPGGAAVSAHVCAGHAPPSTGTPVDTWWPQSPQSAEGTEVRSASASPRFLKTRDVSAHARALRVPRREQLSCLICTCAAGLSTLSSSTLDAGVLGASGLAVLGTSIAGSWLMDRVGPLRLGFHFPPCGTGRVRPLPPPPAPCPRLAALPSRAT